jgi:hypothetical protein
MLEAVGGVPITAGAISGVGVYKKNHKIIFDEDAVILEHSLRARSDQFGHLKYGDSLVVFDANAANGVFFKVKQEPMQINSGQDCIIELARVDAPGETVVILDGDPGDDPTTEPTDPPVLILDGTGS